MMTFLHKILIYRCLYGRKGRVGYCLVQAFIFSLILVGKTVTGQVIYIDKALSGNDHKRKQPLTEALEAGFAGISAELKLARDGQLLCGSKPLAELYLNPLKKRIAENGGWVYGDRVDEFLLVLNVTSDSMATYNALLQLLASYPGMVTTFEDNKRVKRAVRIILSGEVPYRKIVSETIRPLTAEEPALKMNTNRDGSCVSLATINFRKIYDWNGEKNMSNMQYHSLVTYIKNAHKHGRWIRLLQMPQTNTAFDLFINAGVDFLEVEDISSFVKYWRNRKTY